MAAAKSPARKPRHKNCRRETRHRGTARCIRSAGNAKNDPRQRAPLGGELRGSQFVPIDRLVSEFDAVVLGCSPDSPASHRKFIAKHGLAVTLLSDPDRGVLERYGAWGEKTMYGKKTMGVTRSTVLIDPQGRIAHRWPKVKAAGHAAEVRDRLSELSSG